jgi:hypothetical protein
MSFHILLCTIRRVTLKRNIRMGVIGKLVYMLIEASVADCFITFKHALIMFFIEH